MFVLKSSLVSHYNVQFLTHVFLYKAFCAFNVRINGWWTLIYYFYLSKNYDSLLLSSVSMTFLYVKKNFSIDLCMLLRNVSDTLLSNLFVLNLYFDGRVAASMFLLHIFFYVYLSEEQVLILSRLVNITDYNNKDGCSCLKQWHMVTFMSPLMSFALNMDSWDPGVKDNMAVMSCS